MLLDIIYMLIGVALLYVGGEWLLKGALATAKRLNIPTVFSAVVLVGFGTSAPELFVTINASLTGTNDIAVGNILGSNVANILLIGGAGFILSPYIHKIKYIGLEIVFFIIATTIPLLYMIFLDDITSIYAYGMLAMLMVYFYMASVRVRMNNSEDEKLPSLTVPNLVAHTLGGILLLYIGSGTLIDSAVNVAILFNVSNSVIGLSVVALGTSLPELASIIVAARRNEGEMILGTILGSNMFNILLIMSSAILIEPIDLPLDIFGIDIIGSAVLSLILVALFYARKLTKTVGFTALSLYALYVVQLVGR